MYFHVLLYDYVYNRECELQRLAPVPGLGPHAGDRGIKARKWRDDMTGLAMTRTAIWDDSLSAARNGILPALIGALGATLALNMMAPLFAPASIPIAVLGIVLGLHGRCLEAVAIGALALVCAMLALINSALFWLAFGIIGSAVTAV